MCTDMVEHRGKFIKNICYTGLFFVSFSLKVVKLQKERLRGGSAEGVWLHALKQHLVDCKLRYSRFPQAIV